MIKRFFPKTIKYRITIIIIISTIITTIIISFFCFSTFQSLLKKNLIQTTGANLQLVMKNSENNMESVENLAKWCCVNSEISSYVANAPNDITARESLNTYYRLKEELLNSTVSNHIRTLLISNDNNALLQIRDNTDEGFQSDGAKTKELPYFEELIEDKSFKWIGLKNYPFNNKENELIIPIIRPIYNSSYSKIDGWVYIAVNKNVITDYLESYNTQGDSNLYIIINKNIYLYKDKKLEEVSEEYEVIEKKDMDYNKNISYYLVKDDEEKIHAIVSYKSSLDGWYIAQSISNKQFEMNKSIYCPLILVIILLLFSLGIILTYTFNIMINKPISKINKKINQISNGDFSKNMSIESSDEIGTIGKGVNILSQNVSELIESRVEYEKQKKELEFKMLQNQINPHFLYNTLNSIKWMATIQNASGIPEMTTALARLLKNIAKGTSEIITIKEELSLLNDYITIQQYKYGGTITISYKVFPEDIYECSIIKFTLQPIVENAIFHGIEPKGTKGTININIKDIKRQKIVIEVIDDGVGMSQEKIKEMFITKNSSNKRSFNKIGVSNVNERLKLTFGNEYGLKVKSEVDKYTKVIISLPYKKVCDIVCKD